MLADLLSRGYINNGETLPHVGRPRIPTVQQWVDMFADFPDGLTVGNNPGMFHRHTRHLAPSWSFNDPSGSAVCANA